MVYFATDGCCIFQLKVAADNSRRDALLSLIHHTRPAIVQIQASGVFIVIIVVICRMAISRVIFTAIISHVECIVSRFFCTLGSLRLLNLVAPLEILVS